MLGSLIDYSIRQLGPPVFAATIVGCLLTPTVGMLHLVLIVIGLGLMLEAWRRERCSGSRTAEAASDPE